MIKRQNLILMSLAVILLLFYIIVDAVLGYYFLKKDEIRVSDPFFHHGLKPNSQKDSVWGDISYKLVTNSLGFKDNSNRKIEYQSAKERILFMGDSFTEGLGYDYDSTFTGIIAHELKDRAEVLNAGITSYSPKLYFLKTKYLVNSGYKIDQIIVMIDISDIQDEIIYENFNPGIENSLLRSVDLKLSNISFSYHHFFRKMLKKFKSDQTASEEESILEEKITDRGRWTYDEKCYNEWGRKGLAEAEKNMKSLADLCRIQGIKLTIAVYPWPEQLLYDSVESKQVLFWKRFCETNNIDFIDLFPYFFEDSCIECTVNKYFIHGDCHWNYNGHKLIAEKILARIK